jgi:O-antigen/teichoic acid export membrane protein
VTAVSILTLFGAPLVFDWALNGKYTDGWRVLPATMAYCVWFGLLTVFVNYLWCHERPGLACLSVGVGLVLNVVLNYAWLPRWGLSGAVLATAVSNFASLACVCGFCHLLGMTISRGIVVALVLPACLGCGKWTALAIFSGVTWHGCQYGWLFTESERRQLIGSLFHPFKRS